MSATAPRPARNIAHAAWLLCLLLVSPLLTASESPRLSRILMATVNTPDIEASRVLYREQLGYRVVADGPIEDSLAASWGAPEMAGRRQVVLQPASGEPSYLRLVEGSVVPDYQPLTSAGWNAIELLVEDPDRLSRRLAGSALRQLGAPAFLSPGSRIRATQFAGPSGEVLYFTADTGPVSASTLARARSPVDRPFILVVAGRDAHAIADFYRERFKLTEAFSTAPQIPIIAEAQSRDPACAYPLVLLRLAEFSHSLEIDGYGERPPRPQHDGQLPPGVAIGSFLIDDLETLGALPYMAPPAVRTGLPYDGRRSATLVGPAGELIELVENRLPR